MDEDDYSTERGQEPTNRLETDELMTLEQAVDRFFRNGSVTVPLLRRAVRDGRLPVSPLSRRPFLVTREALETVFDCVALTPETRRTRRSPVTAKRFEIEEKMKSSDEILAGMLGLSDMKARAPRMKAAR